MEKLNYAKELGLLHDSITAKTLKENYAIVELLAAHLNTIYGLLSIHDGEMLDIFPVNSPERAHKLIIYLYAISAFQFGSSICEMLIKGQYPEASVLTRSLIETVAFAEYFKNNPDKAFQTLRDTKSLPSRQVVFRFLAKKGKWPNGGPKRAFERYNIAAHGDITSVTSHWLESSGEPQATQIWLRRYKTESFRIIAKDQVIPLLGIQQIMRELFVDEKKLSRDSLWLNYWSRGHNRELIMNLFPEIVIPDSDVEKDHA